MPHGCIDCNMTRWIDIQHLCDEVLSIFRYVSPLVTAGLHFQNNDHLPKFSQETHGQNIVAKILWKRIVCPYSLKVTCQALISKLWHFNCNFNYKEELDRKFSDRMGRSRVEKSVWLTSKAPETMASRIFSLELAKGNWPQSRTYSSTPALHTSTSLPYGSRWITSGAMNCTVPTCPENNDEILKSTCHKLKNSSLSSRVNQFSKCIESEAVRWENRRYLRRSAGLREVRPRSQNQTASREPSLICQRVGCTVDSSLGEQCCSDDNTTPRGESVACNDWKIYIKNSLLLWHTHTQTNHSSFNSIN